MDQWGLSARQDYVSAGDQDGINNHEFTFLEHRARDNHDGKEFLTNV